MKEALQILSEKTSMPILWIFLSIPALGGAILYFSDLRSEARVTSVRVDVLEKRQTILEEDLKIELRHLADKIDLILDNQKTIKR